LHGKNSPFSTNGPNISHLD